MKSKTQLLKIASNLGEFTTKIKSAQETLTPEVAKDIAEEIIQVTEVAKELAEEIAETAPVEETTTEERTEPEQIEVATDESEEEKQKRLQKQKEAQDKKDKEKDEKIATLETKLASMERKSQLAELAPKYASLFPKSMHEAKMNEIIKSTQPLNILEAKVQEASDIISNKTMVKIASMSDSIYDVDDSENEEVSISAKV